MQREGSCQARRKDGSPCRAIVTLGSGYCAMHDPGRQAAVQAARVRGGHNKRRTARVEKLIPATMRPVLTLLLEVLDEIRAGTIPPAQANAIATVAGAVCKVYQAAAVQQEIAELQDQVDRLQSRGA